VNEGFSPCGKVHFIGMLFQRCIGSSLPVFIAASTLHSVREAPYCIRAWSRNCLAAASRNVSTLTPAGISNPDFA